MEDDTKKGILPTVLSVSRFLLGALHRSKFANFCQDLMQSHLL